jgi:hypothetical protein
MTTDTQTAGKSFEEFQPHDKSHTSFQTLKFVEAQNDVGGFYDSEQFHLFRTNNEKLFEYRKIPVRSSYVNDLSDCPRKFMLRNRMGLVPKGRPSQVISIGSIYHLMTEAALRSFGEVEGDELKNAALSFASQDMNEQVREMEKSMDDQGYLPDGTAIEDARARLEQSFAIAQVMFEVGFPRFFQSPVMQGWHPLAVEVPIELKYRRLPATIWCKPDAIFERGEGSDREMMIVSHKTTGKKTGTLAAMYPMSIQMKIEELCVSNAFPDHTPRYYVHNLIKRPTLRYPAKKYPTFDTYLEACKAWYETQAETDEDNPPLVQSLMYWPANVMDRELHIRLYEAARASTCIPDPDRFYRSGHCAKYDRLCPYYNLCNKDPMLWPDLIEKHYDVVHREDDEKGELLND